MDILNSKMRVLTGASAATFMMATSALGGTFNANYNDGLVPAGSQIFGSAAVETAGGVGDTGCLKLTKAINSLAAGYIIEDLDSGANVYGFKVSFQARIGGGSAVPADGWSFCVAPDLPDGTFGETGAGGGIRVCFDTYDNNDGDPNNGAGEAPQIRIVVGGTTVATTPLLPLSDLINNNFVPVEIAVNADGSLDLTYNGKVHFSKLYFPNYQPLVSPRYGFGARTGGLNANHWIDDLSIQTYTTAVPGIVQGPQSVRILEGSSATFSATLNNADGATIAWLKNGVAIPGETGLTYTLAGAALADDGAKISVRVTSGGTVLTSPEATLNVVRIELPATADASFDFNSGLPANTLNYGTGIASDGVTPWIANVFPTGGVGDSGVLELTEAVNDQRGAFLIPDMHNNQPVYGVAARFDLRIGGGSETPADGMSFNFASDLPDALNSDLEEGVGSGLRVCFDIYNNGNNEAPAITLKWGNTVISEAKVALADITTGSDFADVIVRVTPDGLLDVAWNGKVLVYRAPVTGFGSIAGGRFGFYARTGGLNANQWVDNLKVYTYLTAPLRISKQPAALTTLIGHTANFSVEVNQPQGTTFQWLRNGQPISGATSASLSVPNAAMTDDGAKFKVTVTFGAESVTSDEVVLSVFDLAPPSNPQMSYDFNSGLPATCQISGTTIADGTGGVSDSGVIKLTTSQNSQSGGFLTDPIASGAQLLDFTLAADIFTGNGTTPPADGFSINVANDLPLSPPGEAEAGAGNGITITFDTFDNGGGEAPSIDVKYKSILVVSKIVPQELVNSGRYDQLLVRVSENGTLDLAFGDVVVFRGLNIPNYVPMSGLRVAMYARTGGLNASYWLDNLRVGARVPATISITEQPADALVLDGQPASFKVLVSNPAVSTFQWNRNGSPIANATGNTYTTPALSLADEGVTYSVTVTGPGNVVTSRSAVVAVMTKFQAGSPLAFDYNFNDGQVPPNGIILGNAIVQPTGGVNDSGFMQLTEAVNSQSSAFELPTPDGVTSIADFTATWMMRVGGGSDTPADGYSFVVGPDIPDATFGEDGAGSGLIVSYDIFDNGSTEDAPEITIRYKANDVITRPFPISVLRTGSDFVQLGVRVNRNGTLDLYYGNTAVYRGVVLPNYTPFTAGRFGWGARTGGLNENQWMDDLKISINTQAAEGPRLNVALVNGNLVITWAGGGVLQSATTIPGSWGDIAGATSGYTTSAAGAAKFFRVRQ